MAVEKYRKKPVEIEAVEFTKENAREIFWWLNDGGCDFEMHGGLVVIKTLEGAMTAQFGDYIIKGVQGEFYPCKPDIFEQTYEKESE